MKPKGPVRVGADVGGTFTDVVLADAGGSVWTAKVPSTPPDFETAVLDGISRLLQDTAASGSEVAEVVHGTTVATNAILERRGALTALITTRGFRDVLELRRIRAPQMYDLFFQKPPELVERCLRFELGERLSARGEVLAEVDPNDLEHIALSLKEEKVESVAVCLLHAYAWPRHENLVGEFLRRRLPEVPISLSSEVLRERKEYERTATTVVNAYVRPVMRGYLAAMRSGLADLDIRSPLLIMQSAGGLTPEEEAARRPVYMLESGPAAGVLASQAAAGHLGLENVITLDMGGTTAKASLIEEGRVRYSPEYEVGASLSAGNRLTGGGGELIRAPSIDLAEVGSGGGSIAWLDGAGGVRVGPRSAGAVPGPACYSRGGGEPTVTDANVVLGYIRPGRLANGDIAIDPDAAARAVRDRISTPLGMDLLQAAEGVHRIANARTMRALRAVSTERGRDPREFVLMAFGGSGPVHAAGLARELHIRKVVVPPLPGLFSALGLLASGVEHHDVRSCLLPAAGAEATSLEHIRQELRRKMLDRFQAEGYAASRVALSWSADLRFQGQASEIRLGLPGGPLDGPGLQALNKDFEAEHERLYGHRSDPENPTEIIAVRLVGQVAAPAREAGFRPRASALAARSRRQAYFGSDYGLVDTPVVARSDLSGTAGGPLLIDEYDSTIVVPPFMSVGRDEHGNVVMEVEDA